MSDIRRDAKHGMSSSSGRHEERKGRVRNDGQERWKERA